MPTAQERQFLKSAIEEEREQLKHIRSIMDETSPNGQRVLIVHYSNDDWDGAIERALDAYGLQGDERLRLPVIALPEKAGGHDN
jgi:hypothetical protein